MKEKWNETKVLSLSILVLVLLVIVYLIFQILPFMLVIFRFLKAIFGPFIVAMIISYLLNPIVNLLSRRTVPRSVAVLLIYSLFLLSIVVIVINTLPLLEDQLEEMVEHLPKWNEQIQFMINEYNDHGRDLLPTSIQNAIERSLNRMEQSLGNAVSRLLDGIGNTINQFFFALIVPFLAFYMLRDIHAFEKTFKNMIPRAKRKEFFQLLREIDQALGNYIRGQLLVCVIVGVLVYIGYWLIGLPYALILACIVGIFNIIPYLGPVFGAIPAVFVAFTISPKVVIAVILTNFIVQLLEGNVLSPQIVGRSLHMHPLLIIFALLVGGEIGGIMGLILAVPFFAVGKVMIEHIIRYYVQSRVS